MNHWFFYIIALLFPRMKVQFESVFVYSNQQKFPLQTVDVISCYDGWGLKFITIAKDTVQVTYKDYFANKLTVCFQFDF